MTVNFNKTFLLILLTSTGSFAQINSEKQKVVLITGARFTYPLVQKWIDDYSSINPDVQVLIESRGTADPAQYDILIDAYEHDEEVKRNREYIYMARYAIVIVASSRSKFAATYIAKGLNKELIRQLFFYNVYAGKENDLMINDPHTIYTRLQKAAAPIVFAKYFGFDQKDIKGKFIAGSDEHLLKALLRDSTGVSYLPLPLAYELVSRKPLDGLAILPVDLNGNGRVHDDERFYDVQTKVIQRLEDTASENIHNIPVEYLHFSVGRHTINPEAVKFLRWVIQNGQKDLGAFGYLQPEDHRFEKAKFE